MARPTPCTARSTPSPIAHRPPRLHRPRGAAGLPAFAALLLAACQTAGDPAAATPVASTAAPPGAPTTLPGTCGGGDSPAQALARLNDYRAVGARCGAAGPFPSTGALQWQATLAQVAATRARTLAESGGSVSVPGDDHLTARLHAAGYAAQAAAENRAAGPDRFALLLADWVRGPATCARMLSASYTEAGLACQRAPDGSAHWVLVLARPR